MAAALETGTNDLLGRIEDRVAVLTFNRPDRRNALSPSLTHPDAADDTLCFVFGACRSTKKQISVYLSPLTILQPPTQPLSPPPTHAS